jgi:hypothetical protein
MSQRYKMPPIDFEDFRDTYDREHSVPVKLGGKVFTIKAPELLSDEQYRTLEGSEDPEVIARLLIDDYDEYVAAGGTAILAGVIMAQQAEERAKVLGGSLGESAASSDS